MKMSIREIVVGRFGFLAHLTTVLHKQNGSTQGRLRETADLRMIQGIGRSVQSPFDVRYGNQTILQFRHDYIR
jgi:hypothetical protein